MFSSLLFDDALCWSDQLHTLCAEIIVYMKIFYLIRGIACPTDALSESAGAIAYIRTFWLIKELLHIFFKAMFFLPASFPSYPSPNP